MYSIPVPTNGARARSSGTAWRCMFEPISARLASSFSRNGISEAATDTSCLGRDVDEIDLLRRRQDELSRLTGVDPLIGQASLVVDGRVGLSDDVLILLPGRQIEGVWLEFRRPLLPRLGRRVLVERLVQFDDIARLELRAPTRW